MSSEHIKAIRRRFQEEVENQRNLAAIDEFFGPDFVDHFAMPGFPAGLEGVKARHAALFAAFPDIQSTVEDMIAEGDKVVARLTMRGTHKGEFLGIPATGKQLTVSAIDIMRIVDDKIVEHWVEVDMLGMMQQLGVIPAPGESGS